MAFSVGDTVLNIGRGCWRRGVVICVVPAGASAFRLARKLGHSGCDIREDSIRSDREGYLVKTEDCSGRVRVRFPAVTGIAVSSKKDCDYEKTRKI